MKLVKGEVGQRVKHPSMFQVSNQAILPKANQQSLFLINNRKK